MRVRDKVESRFKKEVKMHTCQTLV